MIKKVGILTWHYYSNFGSQLQAHALTKIVRDLGYKCRVLNYRNPKYGKISILKNCIYNVFCSLPESIVCLISNKYKLPQIRFKKFLHETKIVYNEIDLIEQSQHFDAIICGSDQIWAPNVYNPIYMLNFVGSGIRKISYAASIGLNDIPECLTHKYMEHLSTFDDISVREEKGKDLLLSKCNIESTVVLDPTLMISAKYWDSISTEPQVKGDYIFCYLLNKNHTYSAFIMNFAKHYGIPIYAISANPDDKVWANLIQAEKIGPRDFLGLIRNAHTVITDSYHGTIFSLLFHKRFLTIERFVSSDAICQNSRIKQLDTYFKISRHIIKTHKLNSPELHFEPIPSIDWDLFEQKLSQLREESKSFIRKSLR